MSYEETISIEPPAATGLPRRSRAAAKAGAALLRRLDDLSDRLSPIVVKEVRQIVRGREFNYSFIASLVVGLLVAFFGAANVSAGTGTAGRSVFGALMACLTALGVAIVPIGAFSALRNERLEQTIDLITVTSLTARKVVIGKLLAQAVKLATLFAGVAPFVATSFLLGGIDFVTVVVSLAAVFFGSLWVCAAALLLSSLARSRGMSGVLLIGAGFLILLFFGGLQIVGAIIFAVMRGGRPGALFAISAGTFGAQGWWSLGIFTTLGAVTLVNLVLLAENRLSSPVDDKATALRAGFFVQFLAIVLAFCTLSWFGPPLSNPAEPMAVLALVHLAVVAAFTVSEDFDVSRRVQRQMRQRSWSRPFGGLLWPGAGHGAAYTLVQMGILVMATWHLTPDRAVLRWVLAACGYLCFFTGVPAVALRYLHRGIRSFLVRIAILVAASASLVLPDVLYYLFARPERFGLRFGARHLVNPIRTIANWNMVEMESWFAVPWMIGAVGVLSYFALIAMSLRAARPDERPVSLEMRSA